MQRNQYHRLLALLLTIVTIFQFVIISPDVVFAENTEANTAVENALPEESNAVNEESGKEEEPLLRATKTGTVLTFTSDTHNKSGNKAANRLGTWIENVVATYGGIDVMAFGGDMAGANASGYWDLTQADMDVLADKEVTGVYTTGNHEISMGGDFSYSSYTSGSYSANETKGQFRLDQQVAEGSDYRIYCLGSHSSNQSYSDQKTSLTNYLNSVGNDKVIFIITHFPLHKNSSRTTTGAANLISVLNNAVTKNKQVIVFLWGHNHTNSDTYYDQIYGPGTSLSTDNGSQTIQFYYGAAGCMSDSENGTGSAYVKGKGLVATITHNRGETATLGFAYYNESGSDVTETSSDSIKTATVKLGEEISGDEGGDNTIDITPASSNSPEESVTIAVGETLTINVTNGSTSSAYDFTATLSKSGVAEIEPASVNIAASGTGQFTVTGVTDGTVDITIQNNGQYSNRKATIHLTVGEGETPADTPVGDKTVAVTPASSNSPEESVTIAVGETLTINVTNGSTSSAYDFTATLSKSGVAEIEPASVNIAASGTGQFTVTGVTDGTVDITIQNNGQYSNRKATIHLTVGDGGNTPGTESMYELVSNLEDGGEYLIVNDATVGSESSRALKNPGGSSSGVAINSSNGKTTVEVLNGNYILTGDTDIVWTATANRNGFYLTNNGDYLEQYYSSNSHRLMVFSTVKQEDRYWTYSNQNLGHIGGSSDYYLTYASGTFNVSTTASNIYLFKKVVATVDPETVSVSPTTLNLTEGETSTLTATVTPANANKSITWSTSEASVATVANGVVTAVGAGTATITATTVNGKTATCSVTVTVAPTTTYVQTNTLTAGKEYLIVSGNSGSVLILTSEKNGTATNSKQLKGISATVSADGKLTIADSAVVKALFTAEANSNSSQNGFWLKNGDGYLYAASTPGLSMTDSSTLSSNDNKAKSWHYKADGKNLLWFFKDASNNNGYTDTSNTYKYYLDYSSGSYFTDGHATTTSLENTTTPAIYLFVKDDGTQQNVPVTGVTLDKSTVTVEVGKTTTLTATVTPSDATNKSVTWSTSDATKATVSNGTVTGVAEGTVIITVTTTDGSYTANCTVTVEESNDVRYELVSSLEDGGEYLIVNANSGSAYALKNPGTSGTNIANSSYRTAVTIQSGEYILTSDTDIVWTATANGSGFNLSNNGLYLEGANRNVSVYSSLQNSDRYWTYNSSNYLQHNGGSSTYNLRYSSSSNYFQGSTSNTGAIYLFKKATPTVDPETVSVSPTTLNLTEGETSTLTATVTPANANKSITWSTSEASVATVANGVVTAVGAGTATITATTVNGKTATCSVTVTVAPTTTYVQTNTLTAGKEYLIVSGNSGSVLILTSEKNGTATNSKQLKGISATVSADGKLTIADSAVVKALFTAEANSNSSQNGFWLKNGDNYLYAASTPGLSMTDSSTLSSSSNRAKSWHYKADGKNLLWFFKDADNNNGYTDTTDTYKYYLNYSSGTYFTDEHATSTSLENTSTPAIYLFVKDDGTHEHTYGEPSYTWSADNSTCTATIVCSSCEEDVDGHSIEETVNTTSEITKAATCTAKGETTYTATFTNAAFATQTKTVEDINALGHDLVHHDAKPATCTEAGWNAYDTCSRCDYTTYVEIPATGHSWNTATYSWAEDNSTVTATRICKNDATHTETETVTATFEVIVEATETAAGTKRFTSASFKNTAFSIQIKDVEIPPTGYVVTYDWADDFNTVTGTAIPYAQGIEPIIETVNTTSEITKAATCTAKGETTYTATFTNAAFATQTKTVEDINALGHDLVHHDAKPATCTEAGWNAYDTCSRCDYTTYAEIPATGHSYGQPSWSWNEGHNVATATFTCTAGDDTKTLTDNSPVEELVSAATCTADKVVKYRAKVTFNNKEYTNESGNVTLSGTATGHDWEVSSKEWNADHTSVVVHLVCGNNADHFHDETVTQGITCEITEATSTQPGRELYSVTFTYDGQSFNVTDEVITPALGSSVTVNVKSWNSETDDIVIILMDANTDTEVSRQTVHGNTAAYTFSSIQAGTYKVKISKKNHAEREYTDIVVGATGVVVNAEIRLYGDLNGDGKVTTFDAARANSHAKGVSLLTGYDLAVADVIGSETGGPNGEVTTIDAARINSHARGLSSLWT